jgi:hypothetical protein
MGLCMFRQFLAMMKMEIIKMLRNKSTFFFATKNDLSPGLKIIESKIELKYIETKSYESKSAPIINSALDISEFGYVHDRRSTCFIVMPQSKHIFFRRIATLPKNKPGLFGIRPGWRRNLAFAICLFGIKLPGGKVHYEVYPVDYPSSIVFCPGGFFDDSTLVSGEICTIFKSKSSIELYELFKKELLRGFIKIKGKFALLGPEAYECLKKGLRLTSDVNASPIVDFKLD